VIAAQRPRAFALTMTGVGTSTAVTAPPAVSAERTRDLYTRHGQRVYSFCLSRLRNPEEAQDAAQTTFVYVLSALKRGVVPRNELAWLLTIADNVCRSTRRSIGRRRARLANADVDELEAAASSISAETNETLDALRTALEELPNNQRRAILLREWQGLSYVDIADQLGLSLAAVETLLFRARRGLAARLERTRTGLRVLDIGSALVLLRSVVGGAAGKVAVGAAGVVLVAAAPGVEREVRAGGLNGTLHPALRSPIASGQRSSVLRETARRLPSPTRATPTGRAPARVVRKLTVRPVRATAATQAPKPAPAPAPAPPPTTAPTERSNPLAVPPPVSVPATVPAPPPLEAPAAAQTAVTTVTQTSTTVVSATAQAAAFTKGQIGG
jgi:RNA polymerase sigma-70 factor (ECF subfamily)